jgi:hypothetical protein
MGEMDVAVPNDVTPEVYEIRREQRKMNHEPVEIFKNDSKMGENDDEKVTTTPKKRQRERASNRLEMILVSMCV